MDIIEISTNAKKPVLPLCLLRREILFAIFKEKIAIAIQKLLEENKTLDKSSLEEIVLYHNYSKETTNLWSIFDFTKTKVKKKGCAVTITGEDVSSAVKIKRNVYSQ